MTPAGIIMHGHCRPVGNQNSTVSVKVKTTGGPEPLAASATCMRRRPALTPGTARSNSTYGRLRWVVAVTYAPCWRSAIRCPGVRSMHVALNLPPTISSYPSMEIWVAEKPARARSSSIVVLKAPIKSSCSGLAFRFKSLHFGLERFFLPHHLTLT
jgi:hypothetical protein